jgi:hypothetical protein
MIGSLHIGVRSNTVAVDNLLRKLLAAHLVEAADAPPNYSLRLADQESAPAGLRQLNLLYRSSVTLVRSRHPGRVVGGLLQFLSSHIEPTDLRLLRIRAAAVVGEGGAVMVPWPARATFDLARLERRLGGLGLRLLDAEYATVDPDTCELVVAESLLEVDRSALAEAGLVDGAYRDEPLAPGRYPVRAWTHFAAADDHQDLSRGGGMLHAAQTLLPVEPLDAQRRLDRLAHVLEEVPLVGVSNALQEFAAQVAELSSSVPAKPQMVRQGES